MILTKFLNFASLQTVFDRQKFPENILGNKFSCLLGLFCVDRLLCKKIKSYLAERLKTLIERGQIGYLKNKEFYTDLKNVKLT